MVSDVVAVSAITVIGGLFGTVLVWALKRLDKKADARALEAQKNLDAIALVTKNKLDEMHKEFDGMKDALIKSEKIVSKDEGNREGRAELKSETKVDEQAHEKSKAEGKQEEKNEQADRDNGK